MIKIIKDFLPEQEAKAISTAIYNTPSNWWSYAYKHAGLEKPKYFTDTAFGTSERKKEDVLVTNSFQTGAFSYKFRRSTTHVPTCTCYECNFKKQYLEKEVKTLVSEVCGFKNPYIFESFTSVYSSGDFLNTHKDHNRGVAFIYQLTPNWLPEYGGALHILGNEPQVIYPEFNTLTLMQLENDGVPHFVSEVSERAPYARVAITGWYNES